MVTPFNVLKKPKNGTFARKQNGTTGQKTLACRHNLTANMMGWVPSGHTSSSSCIRLKMPKCYFKKHFDLITFHFCLKILQHMSSKQTFL